MGAGKLLVPPRLEKGDTIGVVSPSSGVTKDLKPQFHIRIKFLKSLGFRVTLGKNALKVDHYSAGTREERAEDINSMFANPRVKPSLPARENEFNSQESDS